MANGMEAIFGDPAMAQLLAAIKQAKAPRQGVALPPQETMAGLLGGFTAPFQGAAYATGAPDVGGPVIEPGLQALISQGQARDPYREPTGPSPIPGLLTEPANMPAAEDPGERLRMLEALRGGGEAVGPETVTSEGEVEGAIAGERGQLPEITGPGDIPREKRRADIEKRLATLSAFRDISEGLGRGIPTKGTLVAEAMGAKSAVPQDFKAEGIRDAMARGELDLADLDLEQRQEMQAELALGKRQRDTEEKARVTLNKAATDLQKPTSRIGKIQDSLFDSEQVMDLLSGDDVTETDFQQALTLVIKSMGREVGNIAEKERRNYADLVGVKGMFRKGARWLRGKPSAGQVESVRQVAELMAGNLAKRGRAEIKTQTGALWNRNQRVFSQAGITREGLVDELGLTMPEGAGGEEVAAPEPEGEKVRITKPGEKDKIVLAADLNEWDFEGWSRAVE